MLLSYFFFSSRRRHTRLTCDWSSDVCSSDLITVDFDRHLVTVDGHPITLSRTEFELLALFARNEGKLLTHRAILREVWEIGRASCRERVWVAVVEGS